MDIVLNSASQRKSPSVVGFTREGDRIFGDPARRLTTRFPERVFGGLTQLLGKSIDSPWIDQIRNHYAFKLVGNDRGAISVEFQNTTFLPEELLAMLLQQAREMASTESKSAIKDCVITIPPYLTESERQGIIDSARLAGLNVLGLIHEGTAAALNYALLGEVPQEEEKHMIFYDLGAGSLKLTLVGLKSVNETDGGGSGKRTTVLKVKAVAWDRTLGGRDFDAQLALHFASILNKQLPSGCHSAIDIVLTMLLLF